MKFLFAMLLLVATTLLNVAFGQDTNARPQLTTPEPAAYQAMERAAFGKIITDLDAEVKRVSELHKSESNRIEKMKAEMLSSCESASAWYEENGQKEIGKECRRIAQEINSISVSDPSDLEMDSTNYSNFLTLTVDESSQLWGQKEALAELNRQLSNLHSYEIVLKGTFAEVSDEIFIMDVSKKGFAETVAFYTAEQAKLEETLQDIRKENDILLSSLQKEQAKLEKAAFTKFGNKETSFRTEHSNEVAGFKITMNQTKFSSVSLSGYELKDQIERLKFNLSGLNQAISTAGKLHSDLEAKISEKKRTTKHFKQ